MNKDQGNKRGESSESNVKTKQQQQPKNKRILWKNCTCKHHTFTESKSRRKIQSSHRFTVQAPAQSYRVFQCRRGNKSNHINNHTSQNDRLKQARAKTTLILTVLYPQTKKTSFITLCTAIQDIYLSTLAIHELPGHFNQHKYYIVRSIFITRAKQNTGQEVVTAGHSR